MGVTKHNGATLVRRRNVAACWAALRELGEASVAEISKKTGLSRPTTQPIVRELAERGLALVSEARSERPGRPGERYTFIATPISLACLDLDQNGTVTFTQVDFNAKVSDVSTVSLAGETLSHSWELGCASLLAEQNPDILIVSMPGVVEPSGRVLVINKVLEWSGLTVADTLGLSSVKRFVVENHVNMEALAESRVGVGRGVLDQVYLYIEQGIKAGIIIGGQLHRGANFAAGEGNSLDRLTWSLDPSQTDKKVLVDRLVGLISGSLGVMIGTLDPGIVVLGGTGAKFGGAQLRKKLSAALGGQLSGRPEPELRLAKLGGRSALLGAAIRAVEVGTAAILDGELVASPAPEIELEAEKEKL